MELNSCRRSHFGSRYRLGCCGHTGLLLHQFDSCRARFLQRLLFGFKTEGNTTFLLLGSFHNAQLTWKGICISALPHQWLFIVVIVVLLSGSAASSLRFLASLPEALGRKNVRASRFVRVALAQGPCQLH